MSDAQMMWHLNKFASFPASIGTYREYVIQQAGEEVADILTPKNGNWEQHSR